MKNKRVLLLVAAMVLLLGGAYVLYDRLSDTVDAGQLGTQGGGDETQEPELQPMPDFTVYDREGREVHLTDFRGKPVVLNFWASWCSPCRQEMPDFNAAYQELGEEVQFLMVNMTTSYRESYENATEFMDESGYSFPVYYDTTGSVADTYGVSSLPTTLFIDGQGYGIAYATGAINRDLLQQGIDMILSK